MGSGKTYEVVSVVILGALARGRRVVTNIAGINYPAMVDLLVEQGVEPEKIGTIVQIDHEKVLDPFFWRADVGNEDKSKFERFMRRLLASLPKTDEEGKPTVIKEFFIQRGDLVVLDEIWRFWGGFGLKDEDGHKCPSTVMNFFRMHRHFTHPETGVSCDVALITQDVADIARRVRAVIEETYYMEKLTAIGSSKRYRVDVHQGGKIGRKPLRSLQRSYEEKYFGLYKSHSGHKEGEAGPKEENIDKRGNILGGAIFKVVIPLFILIFGFAVYYLWGFFHPKPKKTDNPAVASSSSPNPSMPAKPSSNVSDTWRVYGWYTVNSSMVAILKNNDGRLRHVYAPQSMRLAGLDIAVTIDGENFTTYSGSQHSGLIDSPRAGK